LKEIVKRNRRCDVQLHWLLTPVRSNLLN